MSAPYSPTPPEVSKLATNSAHAIPCILSLLQSCCSIYNSTIFVLFKIFSCLITFQSPSSKHESPLQRKKKVKKPYKVVNHSISVPGSVGKETRHFVFTKKSSPPTPLIPSTKESRRLKMEQIHMQRSCSVDALNEIDEKEKIRMSSELKKAPLRRSTSSGVSAVAFLEFENSYASKGS